MSKKKILITALMFSGLFVLAPVYLCDNGECLMLVEQYSNGYSWQIDCGMGQTDGGWIEGGTYGGNCPELPGANE